jgi:DNA-binding SARP family transcriptional activator
VWVDATAFERLAANAESLLECGDPQGERDLKEALTLYAGHFLAADDDLPWVVPHRARLRDRFVRLADLAGARCEATGDWQRAERYYRHAIALEPTAETIHQRLIRSLAEMGRPAEALDAYRRCRELLSIVLGMRPSPRTEALCDRIRGGVGRAPVCEE